MSVSIEEALAQLDPKLRKRLGSGVGVNYEYQPTPSFGLNRALGGGLPYGRQVLIWGSKSSAKSSMCLQMIALAQAEGKLCAWIDSEMSYSEDWARTLGVDPEKLIYSQARTISDMVDVGVGLMNAGVDLIVVDSKIKVGDKLIEEKIGRTIKWELQFSKTSPGFQSGEYDFYFRGDDIGLDTIGDLVTTAELNGIVERTGAWYILPDGTKVQGKEAFVNRVREDLDLQESIKAKLNA